MAPGGMRETHLPVEVRNVIVRPFATTTPEKVCVDPFRRSIPVYVPSSLMTRVALPNALPPPASEPTGAYATCHVPTRSLGRAYGRTSDSVDWATPYLFECVGQPESAINATLATNKIPRFTILMASSGSARAGAS